MFSHQEKWNLTFDLLFDWTKCRMEFARGMLANKEDWNKLIMTAKMVSDANIQVIYYLYISVGKLGLNWLY